jgi:diamine N-acetyltransferase
MLYDNPEKAEYFLWRLMVDNRYQGKGYGRSAVEHLIDYVKTRPNATELLVSYVPGEGSPLPFYEALGFVDTGEMEGDEKVMRLVLGG